MSEERDMSEEGSIYKGIPVCQISTAEMELRRQADILFYSDDSPPRKPSLRMRFRIFRARAHDAWLVLTGREEIGW